MGFLDVCLSDILTLVFFNCNDMMRVNRNDPVIFAYHNYNVKPQCHEIRMGYRNATTI